MLALDYILYCGALLQYALEVLQIEALDTQLVLVVCGFWNLGILFVGDGIHITLGFNVAKGRAVG